MKKDHKPRIGISIGDTNGIGIELILKAFSDVRIAKQMTPIIYASIKVLNAHRKLMNLNEFHYHKAENVDSVKDGKVNVLNIWNEEVVIEIGKPTKESGRYAFRSLEAAVTDLKKSRIDALVTCPISKDNIQSRDFNFPGHTEYLQDAFQAPENLMFLLGERLRIGLVTNHLPLSEVAANITKEGIVAKLKLMSESLKMDFSINGPKIAVLGLNPHAGDNGLLGSEEKDVIRMAIAQARELGIYAYGPFSADGFFGSGGHQSVDAVLAMYHDQGLIPFKLLEFGSGVNFTAGIPKVRTSPDHGTGFDIAGKGEANIESFRSALFMAMSIVNNREENLELQRGALVRK